MDTKLLEDIGLTRSEALVYLALCELGPSTTGKIIQKAGVASSKIYEILDRLEQKGLAGHAIRTGIKEFQAAPPERIMLYLEEKENEIKREMAKAETLVHLLKSKLSLAKEEQEATIYRGMKGLKTVFYQVVKELKPGSTMTVIGVPARSPKVDRFFVRWNKFRANNNVKMKIMFDESARGNMQTLPENNPLSEIKFMPKDVITPAGINIADDKTIIFPSESGEDPLLILIKSKKIADSFKAQFDLLWSQNVKTFYGLDGPRYVLNDMMRDKRHIWAFGLSHEKLQTNVPEELKSLIEFENKNKIPVRLIFTSKKEVWLEKYASVRYLSEKFSTPFHYEIYGNKVAIFYWIKPVITTLIEDKNVADNFRKHFEEMWKITRK